MQRIRSVDILRGAIMVLMAIDHVRVYSGVPAGGPEPGIFLTRWVTHFCAPGFAFLAGTSAFLYGEKLKDVKRLSRYLLVRGLLLVILELTLIRYTWTFNFNYSEFTLAGIIWMLGWCMVMMAALVRINAAAVGITGLLIVVFQQVFQHVPKLFPAAAQQTVGEIWAFFYPSGFEQQHIAILYVLIPWIGVMAAGYGFGKIVLMPPAERRKLCLRTGLVCIALFVVTGSILAMKNPGGDAAPFVFRLLNQQKYPASQLFLLMTLGPLIALIPFAETLKGGLAHVLTVFGRVPFFYYLLHIPVIHISALLVNFIREGNVHQDWYNTAPFTWIPEEYRWGLPLLYLVLAIDLVLLYVACRWYMEYKSGHPEKKWLKYI